jgi:hypothetical protein
MFKKTIKIFSSFQKAQELLRRSRMIKMLKHYKKLTKISKSYPNFQQSSPGFKKISRIIKTLKNDHKALQIFRKAHNNLSFQKVLSESSKNVQTKLYESETYS